MTMQIVRRCSLSIHHFVETVHNESVGKKEQATTSKARLFQHQRLALKFDESMSFGRSDGYNLGSSVVFHGFVHYGMITSGVGNLTLDPRHPLCVHLAVGEQDGCYLDAFLVFICFHDGGYS